MEAQRAAQTMSAVCFTSCHDDYVRPFGWTKFVIIYIANAAWLLRPLNILVCYFMMPASMRPTKKYYISERRLTLMISHTSSEWRLRPPTTTTASSQTCARGDPSIERLPRLSSLPSTSSFRRFHAASPRQWPRTLHAQPCHLNLRFHSHRSRQNRKAIAVSGEKAPLRVWRTPRSKTPQVHHRRRHRGQAPLAGQGQPRVGRDRRAPRLLPPRQFGVPAQLVPDGDAPESQQEGPPDPVRRGRRRRRGARSGRGSERRGDGPGDARGTGDGARSDGGGRGADAAGPGPGAAGERAGGEAERSGVPDELESEQAVRGADGVSAEEP